MQYSNILAVLELALKSDIKGSITSNREWIFGYNNELVLNIDGFGIMNSNSLGALGLVPISVLKYRFCDNWPAKYIVV